MLSGGALNVVFVFVFVFSLFSPVGKGDQMWVNRKSQ